MPRHGSSSHPVTRASGPYFPLDGNGGYDVEHYALGLRFDPATGELDGVATITAAATQNLSRFNFDFDGLTVRSITVDGDPATWNRARAETASCDFLRLPPDTPDFAPLSG